MFLRVLILVACISFVFSAPQQIERTGFLGGEPNALGEIPYVVSITIFTGLHVCSGSIISNWWVVTSGQCTFGRGSGTVVMHTGRIRLDLPFNMSDRRGIVLVTHPEYNSATMSNDLGLIQAEHPFNFNELVQPISLGHDLVGGGFSASASGWGTLGPGQINHNFLLTLQTTTLSNTECQSRHTTNNAALIRDDTICTNNGVGEGFCNRAFGSPLVVDGKLIGVASWMVPCGLGYPDVYSRISANLDWITSVTGVN